MRITIATDYAIRAALELAAADAPLTLARIVEAQEIDHPHYLQVCLSGLRRAGIVIAQRGYDGGYRLARPPETITLADLIRATMGAITEVRGATPRAVIYPARSAVLAPVWVELDHRIAAYLETVTLADLCRDALVLAAETAGTAEARLA